MVTERFGGEGNAGDTSDELHFRCLLLLFLLNGERGLESGGSGAQGNRQIKPREEVVLIISFQVINERKRNPS